MGKEGEKRNEGQLETADPAFGIHRDPWHARCHIDFGGHGGITQEDARLLFFLSMKKDAETASRKRIEIDQARALFMRGASVLSSSGTSTRSRSSVGTMYVAL